MPQACTVCAHPERRAIDRELVAGHLVNRKIAQGRELSETAVWRHGANHLPATLVRAEAAREAAHADDLLAQVRDQREKALAIYEKADAAGSYVAAIAALREARGCLELLGELLHELDRRPQVNVILSAEWLAVRSALLEALAPHPDARTAVATRLAALEQPA
jgi:hypothetical protein